MTDKQITLILRRHGLFPGLAISPSKSLYCRRHPDHLVVLNANVFTSRGLILRKVDLDLTRHASILTTAAREAGENFYMLCESDPRPFWEPGSMPMRQVLRSATWWTRIQ